MFALRCTHQLLQRVGPPVDSVSRSTTRLGDWYARLFFTRRGHFILCASERTLLPVLLSARNARTLPARLIETERAVLTALGIAPGIIDFELGEMADVRVARTSNRTVLGSMNDFVRMARFDLDEGLDPFEVTLRLLEAPCGPIAMASPREATLELFAAGLH